ncbi:MAG: aldehyde dehydrogenase [bacterium TMED88]|nr:aldehyde dehydrogenase [Deltaproteobacteria bacterium]OUV21865.1 MAG: aldehyde dehydrogenase [bacterium TMED88]
MGSKGSESAQCMTPIDGTLYVERRLLSEVEIHTALKDSRRAQLEWARTALSDRQHVVKEAVKAMQSIESDVAMEITYQMGRPLSQSPGEIAGFTERAQKMTALAPAALAEVVPEPQPGFTRFIRRVPLGVVFVVAPWNYPYLTAVNAVVPALLAGNAVLLKHSSQTPLCSERFVEIFDRAGLPNGLLQALHLSHARTLDLVRRPGVDFVAFTGSVEGGHAVQSAASERFIGTGLELGGKDPAYVASDAPLPEAARDLADGAFFNAGQSCCGIERIYVHRSIAEEFIEAIVAETLRQRLGDPRDSDTTIGPVVRQSAADFVRDQIQAAVAAGARSLIDPKPFEQQALGRNYLAPQILIDVDHSMQVMTEESFGPVVGIMAVDSDEEAVERMNDSRYGLTASIWTSDEDRALQMGQSLQTGTIFMNRCDYLDPGLAWTGVKDSGRGTTLSTLGYEVLTRPQSFHFKKG